jgi:hypothetical protein
MILGLKDRDCSGLCRPGSYCPQGSTLPTQKICAAGLYGSSFGLPDEHCTGVCEAGYYCPMGSTSSTAFECGDSAHFCPRQTALPIRVGRGNYTIGGSINRRTNQLPCEPGFYCKDGIKISCPAGTFGSHFGLDYSQPVLNSKAVDIQNTIIVEDSFYCSGMPVNL